jgi:uroporphyrinogen decarboxylase
MSLTQTKDLIAALECRSPQGTVPLWELEFHAWQQFSKEPLYWGTAFTALSSLEKQYALFRNAEIMLNISKDLSFSAVTLPGEYWEIAPGEPAFYWLPTDYRIQFINHFNKIAQNELMLAANATGVLAMPAASEYVEFALSLFDDPDAIDTQAQQTLDHGLKQIDRLRDHGIDLFFTASDLADNHGPFFNPEQMDRFILPYLHNWAEYVTKQGGYAILHTDGDVTPYLDVLADSGIHALQAIDPVAGMDIVETRKRVENRLCLCGNIDCGLLLTGTPEQVYSRTRDLIASCKPGGAWVLGASNAVQTSVPRENYQAMVKARNTFGAY